MGDSEASTSGGTTTSSDQQLYEDDNTSPDGSSPSCAEDESNSIPGIPSRMLPAILPPSILVR